MFLTLSPRKAVTRRLHLILFVFSFLVFATTLSYAQHTVSGVVKDTFGEPIIGANVVEKGTTNGSITDIDGKFSFAMTRSTATLVISYIGYESLNYPYKGEGVVTIVLKENSQDLDEIVVVGYGTMKKKDLTGAVSSIKADEITAFAVSNPIQALQGRVPGVVLSQNTGDPSGDYSIRIRGVNSIKGDNSPLYIIDGIPASTSSVNTYDIESMVILKDA